MDKFDIYDWKFKQLIKEVEEDNDINDFIYDLRNSIQKFARSHSDDENMQLLKRLAELIQYYSGDVNESEELNEKENPCWDGYEMVGMKDKDGKSVPNCVPIKE